MHQVLTPKVSVIILSYNAKNDFLDCLESVLTSNRLNCEIIVVDNGSTDECWEALKRTQERYPFLKLVRSELNLGRTGGYNLGLKYVNGEYVLFLDQDTIIDKNMISELAKVLETDRVIGAVGPKIFYHSDPHQIWSVGGSVSLLTGRASGKGKDEVDRGQFNLVTDVQEHPAAILVKHEVIKRIGGYNSYDKDIFMVYCDPDFCLKIWEAGYKIKLSPRAKLWHKVKKPTKLSEALGMKSPLMAFLSARNRIIFMKKHAPRENFLLFFTLFLPMYSIIYSFIPILEMRFDLCSAFWRGTINGIKFAIFGKKSVTDVYAFAKRIESQ